MGRILDVGDERASRPGEATHAGTIAERAETSARSRIRRHPERAAAEQAEAILRAGRIAHVAFAVDGQPYVIPFGYYYEDGAVYLHGAGQPRAQAVHRGDAGRN